MTTALDILEYEERKAERRAEMRWRNDIPLTYEDIEILTGHPYETLLVWKKDKRLVPMNPGSRRPRFTRQAVLDMLQAKEGDNGGHTKSEEEGGPVEDPVQVHGPPDGQATHHGVVRAGRRHRRGESLSRPAEGKRIDAEGRTEPCGKRAAEIVSGIIHDRTRQEG